MPAGGYWTGTRARRLRRRTFIKGAARTTAALTTVNLVGCGDDDDGDGSTGRTATSGASQGSGTPRVGGQYRWAWQGTPHLDMHQDERFRTRPTAAWLEDLLAAGVPAAPVRMREALLDDEQARANDVFVRLEHELLGGLTVVAPPVGLSETPLRAERASPRLGADTEAVLRELGLTGQQIRELAERGLIRTAE